MSIFTPFAFYGSQAVAVSLPDITGGTVFTYTSGSDTYRSHTFYGDGQLVVNSLGNLASAQLLVVAGGGAGGFGNTSGGGGAGGYILSSSYDLITTTYNIKVGAGGAANTNSATSGSPGNLSGFYNVTASGGGGGMGDAANLTAIAGGSGGGAGVNYPNSRGAGIFGQGNSGSRGNVSANPYPAGGGGGAAQAGGTGSYLNAGGSGSFNYLQSGSAISYAGGGFGGTQFDNNTFAIFTSGSSGGSGRGGNRSYPNAATFPQSSSAGLTNYGGGGGGGAGSAGEGSRNGSPGGSGVVIVTYLYQ